MSNPELFALSESIALEVARLRREQEVRSQFPELPSSETVHTAGTLTQNWSDAELEEVHEREMRRFEQSGRTRMLAGSSGFTDTLARRVALRNPRHAASSHGRVIHESLVELSRIESRKAVAQKGGGVRGLLARDEHSLETSAAGRSHSRLQSRRARTASHGSMRAPASPAHSTGVILQSATRLLLGGGQLSSVSIPSKMFMGSNGAAANNGIASAEIDYLAKERGAPTSPPKTTADVARHAGGFERLATNFDVLPSHKCAACVAVPLLQRRPPP